MNVFDEMANYWAEIADKSSTDKQIQFLKNRLKAKEPVLDLACGTGRHLISLAEDGYSIVGLDLSLNLLKIAKKRKSDLQLVRGDMRFLPFKSEAFSAAISMDTSFGYLPSEIEDIQSLIELSKTIIQGGVFNIDVFNREQLILKYKANLLSRFKWALLPSLLKADRSAKWVLFNFFKWKEYPSFFLLQKRKVDSKCEQLQDLWVIRDKSDGKIRVFYHNVRLYEMNHLQCLLENAGFIVSQVYGSYEGKNFDTKSSKLVLVAHKK
jgi:SAM-dependent methyltransferase